MNSIASSKAQPNNAWLFDIVKVSDSLAVSTSTNNIAIFDTETLAIRQNIQKAHEDVITGLVNSNDANLIYSSSRDGTVKCWDMRSRQAIRNYRPTAGVLSVAHHPALDKVAVGTELKGTDAIVSVYDSRSPNALVSYPDSHGEDVTSLSWHMHNNLLLSGGGDGIINVIDTTVVDEDDAILQVFNHGSSIHLAQFVGKNEVLAFSHMETASLYKMSYNQEEVPRDEVKEFGDVRSKLAMDYAISFGAGAPATLFTGSSAGHISIIPFNISTMEFEPDQRIDMESGTEVIRSVHVDHAPDSLSGPLLYAASEDGILRAYSKHGSITEDAKVARKKERRESKSAKKKDTLRFEPY
ncbi:WD domain protein [Taphrina deformans PYCC 5710]|uniref:WD domain protein n=1 Tax=Taphrina deformans (strain PYCC 5710 / ATCC 11124 / CBS 356.35 / IMI 108563 / JCM 9778 / NBRC 8474) TaxID=1097556 RepID=R4XJ78_TAPDE|nr:WD domain protein [Taphrina deformans PYCC 5710]|eukprot:CCG83420.1 WD domain protein [Taphrina deformans PYCC 5710]